MTSLVGRPGKRTLARRGRLALRGASTAVRGLLARSPRKLTTLGARAASRARRFVVPEERDTSSASR
jgi:hypothetical protein